MLMSRGTCEKDSWSLERKLELKEVTGSLKHTFSPMLKNGDIDAINCNNDNYGKNAKKEVLFFQMLYC